MTRPLVERIDRLQRLAVFEASARLGGFTAAARELGLSQPAVTRQIRALERSLGVELFERTSNRSTLSATGQQLFDSVDRGFTTIEHALIDFDRPNELFVLAAPPGFAQQRLVPHMDAIADAIGEPDLRLWLYDREDELGHGSFDVAVRVAKEDWPGYDSVTLFDEVVVPVASPACAAAHHLASVTSPDETDAPLLQNSAVLLENVAVLHGAPLLHMDAEGRPWASWDDWFGEFGLDRVTGRRLTLNNYPSVLQQAVAGRGVALGWRGIVDELLDDGLLVQVGPEIRTERRYLMTWRADRRTLSVDATIASIESHLAMA